MVKEREQPLGSLSEYWGPRLVLTANSLECSIEHTHTHRENTHTHKFSEHQHQTIPQWDNNRFAQNQDCSISEHRQKQKQGPSQKTQQEPTTPEDERLLVLSSHHQPCFMFDTFWTQIVNYSNCHGIIFVSPKPLIKNTAFFLCSISKNTKYKLKS